MEAVRIFAHSVRQVFGNLGAAVRLSALPFLAQAAVLEMMSRLDASDEPSRGPIIILTVLIVLLVLVTVTVIAVNWHRFILNNEPPRWLPRLNGKVSLAYLGRGMLISLVLFAMALPIVLAVMVIARSGVPVLIQRAIVFFLFIVVSYVWLRLSVSLPAIAINEPLPLKQCWRSLRDHGTTLLQLCVGLTLLQTGLSWIRNALLSGTEDSLVFSLLWQAENWVWMMIFLSILTTLYGHYIQGRPLR